MLAACIALLVVPGHAQESPSYTAYEVMKGCQAFIARTRSNWEDREDTFLRGVCVGTVSTLAGYAAALERGAKGTTGACLPSGVTVRQEILVVAAYIDSRPNRLNESFQLLGMEALREAWPCQR